jgi:hypothetical protein
MGAFTATLRPLFGTCAVASNEVGQLLDFIIVKSLLEGQPGQFLLHLVEYTGQRAKAIS